MTTLDIIYRNVEAMSQKQSERVGRLPVTTHNSMGAQTKILDVLATTARRNNSLSSDKAIPKKGSATYAGIGWQRLAQRNVTQNARQTQYSIAIPSDFDDFKTRSISSVPVSVQNRIFACQTEDDWDDEGAIGITRKACLKAIKFLEDTLKCDARVPMPRISASVFGAVTFQWRNEEDHLIIRAFPNSETVS